ncbi:head GIN domain-containing protein [Rufibacter immobilis]|uniref:head GIN domain-containing protein n=1 Tax=Rufibacter immobilis TaxID=1348778 RepID=UPI0035EEB375
MKKLFPYFFLLTILSLHAQAQSVDGNGILKTQNRKVESFTGVRVTGGFEVVLTQGAAESLKLEAEENILPLIETTVQNGTLQIKTKSGIRNAKRLKAYVTVRSLKSLELSGGIRLNTTNAISGTLLKLDFAGGIEAEMNLQFKELDADVAGGSDITLTGRADKVRFDLAGATKLKALNLKADYVTIDAAGASTAQVNAAKELNVDAAGIVNVGYKGSPKVNKSGMGKVKPI